MQEEKESLDMLISKMQEIGRIEKIIEQNNNVSDDNNALEKVEKYRKNMVNIADDNR